MRPSRNMHSSMRNARTSKRVCRRLIRGTETEQTGWDNREEKHVRNGLEKGRASLTGLTGEDIGLPGLRYKLSHTRRLAGRQEGTRYRAKKKLIRWHRQLERDEEFQTRHSPQTR